VFDAASATFAAHTFADITAVGLYHATVMSAGSDRRAGLNFERFRVAATLQGPPGPPTATPAPPTPATRAPFRVALPICLAPGAL
jgi:hypothetical protein